MPKHTDDNEVAAPLPNILLYRHTRKAVKQGCPADRIFLVVSRWSDGTLLAWKCEELPDGRIRHPARWTKPMTIDQLMVYGERYRMRGNNGSGPTANFKPDSFYQLVSTPSVVCDVCRRKPAIRTNVDGGNVCQECYDEGYSDEMPDFSAEPRHVRKHETLVNRLRRPLAISTTSDKVGTIIAVGEKLDAVGEALAYLIDRKWAKKKARKIGKQIKKARKTNLWNDR